MALNGNASGWRLVPGAWLLGRNGSRCCPAGICWPGGPGRMVASVSGRSSVPATQRRRGVRWPGRCWSVNYVVTCTAGGQWRRVLGGQSGKPLPSLTLTLGALARPATPAARDNFTITDGGTDFIVGDTVHVRSTAPTVVGTGNGNGRPFRSVPTRRPTTASSASQPSSMAAPSRSLVPMARSSTPGPSWRARAARFVLERQAAAQPHHHRRQHRLRCR